MVHSDERYTINYEQSGGRTAPSHPHPHLRLGGMGFGVAFGELLKFLVSYAGVRLSGSDRLISPVRGREHQI